jgi:lipopolysaccharide transport system permease protein
LLSCLNNLFMYKVIITAGKKGSSLNLKELLHYRDLFLTLAYRDFKVRYAQTFLGLAWAIIQPLVTLLILVVVFGQVAKIDTKGVPYPIFVMTGMSLWTFFSYVMSQSGTSIIAAQSMIQKIYFPRLIIPFSKAIVGFIDFGITLLFLLGMIIYYQFLPSSNIVFFPIFIILTILSSMAVGVWLSTLTIRYRDFQHVVPFMVQLGLYVTPIAYPADLIPQKYQFVYYLNPMAGIVEGARWSMFATESINEYSYLSFMLVFVLLISGLWYFKKNEAVMADIV